MSQVNFDHKEWCPYCRGETYDDERGHCFACGGPRGRDTHEPKKDTKAEYEEYHPYFIGSQPYYTDGGIPQETEDERVKRVLEWTARCEQEEHRRQREILLKKQARKKQIDKIINYALLTVLWIALLLLCIAAGGLEWLSRVPQ